MNNSSGTPILFLAVAMAGMAIPSAALAAANPPESSCPPSSTPQGAARPETKPAADDVDAWMEKAKNPVPWLKWGADLRLREDYHVNNTTLNKEVANHETAYQRYRLRWWSTLTPVKDVDLNLGINWRGRHYNKPDNVQDFDQGEVLWETLNVKWSHIAGSPLSVTAGRQNLLFGDGWLVIEGNPLDGSRTVFFDAVRLTYDFAPTKTTFDLVYIDQNHEGDRLVKPIKNLHRNVIEQDERGLIFYVANKAIPKTQLDGYFIYKHDLLQPVRNSSEGEIYTFGGRVAQDLTDHWQYRVEGAHQFGYKLDRTLRAFGVNSRVTYQFKDKQSRQTYLHYEFLSGDDPDTPGTDEAFDPLWGRWTTWNEIIYNAYSLETRVGHYTNLHRVGPGWSCKPLEKLDVTADYLFLFADENTYRSRAGFSENGRFRGQLLRMVAAYKFNAHVTARVLTEFFFPGNYYTDFRNDPATFLRGEIFLTF